MKYLLDPAAILEIDEAVVYYNKQKPRLGEEFLEELRTTLRLILENPTRFALLARPIRRAKLQRFPYGIVYAPRRRAIYILAVMHLQRRPDYWKDRI